MGILTSVSRSEVAMSRTRRWSNVPVPEAHLVGLGLGFLGQGVRPAPITRNRSGRLLGWMLTVAGTLLATWATDAAGELDLTRPDRVLRSGPYAFSRHPMYVAWTLLHLGVAGATNNRWMLALVAPVALAIHAEAVVEERRLATRLGGAYDIYVAQVRRYV